MMIFHMEQEDCVSQGFHVCYFTNEVYSTQNLCQIRGYFQLQHKSTQMTLII